MNFFDSFSNDKKIASPDSQNNKKEVYFFENITEFLLFIALYGDKRNVTWGNPEVYLNEFKKAYSLFEQQFAQSLRVLKNCLALNPIGINARFKMCETYIQLHRLDDARNTLFGMRDLLIEKKAIARFYRRLAFIATENKRYTEACACLIFSKNYENHPSVTNELIYITLTSGMGASVIPINPEQTLKNACYPIIPMPEK